MSLCSAVALAALLPLALATAPSAQSPIPLKPSVSLTITPIAPQPFLPPMTNIPACHTYSAFLLQQGDATFYTDTAGRVIQAAPVGQFGEPKGILVEQHPNRPVR